MCSASMRQWRGVTRGDILFTSESSCIREGQDGSPGAAWSPVGNPCRLPHAQKRRLKLNTGSVRLFITPEMHSEATIPPKDSPVRAALSCCSYEPPQRLVSAAQPSDDASVEERAARLAGGSAPAPAAEPPLAVGATAVAEQVSFSVSTHSERRLLISIPAAPCHTLLLTLELVQLIRACQAHTCSSAQCNGSVHALATDGIGRWRR